MPRFDAIYARQSIDKADSISIESQIERCRHETGERPVRIFADKGFSGKNLERPEFRKLYDLIRLGEVARVICYKLDRCSRSIVDFANLMETFQTHGVEFVSCTEKFDTSTPMGRAMLSICIVFAQLERETIQQRVTDTYHSRSAKGYYMGGRVPFGFTLEPCFLQGKKTSRYRVNPPEADILSQMYEAYADPCASLSDVVRILQQKGLPHPRNPQGTWQRTHIGRMLANPIYVKADLDVYRYFRESNVLIMNDPSEFTGTNGCYLFSGTDTSFSGYLVLAPHEGIVNSAVWLQCRRKYKPKGPRSRTGPVTQTWLAGKIKCEYCGYAMVVSGRNSGSSGKFLCSRKCGGAIRKKIQLTDTVEHLVADEMKSRIGNLLSAVPAEEYTGRLAQLKISLEQINQKIGQLVARTSDCDKSLMDHIGKKVSQLETQRQEIQKKICRLCEGKPTDFTPLPDWDTLDMPLKMRLTDLMLKCITVGSSVTLYWNYPSAYSNMKQNQGKP